MQTGDWPRKAEKRCSDRVPENATAPRESSSAQPKTDSPRLEAPATKTTQKNRATPSRFSLSRGKNCLIEQGAWKRLAGLTMAAAQDPPRRRRSQDKDGALAARRVPFLCDTAIWEKNGTALEREKKEREDGEEYKLLVHCCYRTFYVRCCLTDAVRCEYKSIAKGGARKQKHPALHTILGVSSITLRS